MEPGPTTAIELLGLGETLPELLLLLGQGLLVPPPLLLLLLEPPLELLELLELPELKVNSMVWLPVTPLVGGRA